MARRVLRWSIVLVVLAILGIGLWHVSRPEPLPVVLKSVERGVVERTVANTRAGTVNACRRAKMSPSVGGQIAQLPVKEGERVTTGQLLLALWDDDLAAQAELARQEVIAGKSRARSACLRAKASRRNANRLVTLERRKVVPEEQVDNAVSEADSLAAECQAQQTQVAVATARLSVARANLARMRLIAPFDGVVAEINGELSEFVTPSPLGVATPPAVDLIATECFYVSAPIDEVDAADIRVAMPARVTMDAFKDRTFVGAVRRIADYVLDIEKQARTVDVEVAFDDPAVTELLLAGYSADIEVILAVRQDVVRVPTEAIVDGRFVFVYDASLRQLTRQTIDIGLANWNWTEVVDGLKPGDAVVVNVDKPGLSDGVAAEPIEETP